LQQAIPVGRQESLAEGIEVPGELIVRNPLRLRHRSSSGLTSSRGAWRRMDGAVSTEERRRSSSANEENAERDRILASLWKTQSSAAAMLMTGAAPVSIWAASACACGSSLPTKKRAVSTFVDVSPDF